MAHRTAGSLNQRLETRLRHSYVSRWLYFLALSVGFGAAQESPDRLIRQVQSRYNGARTLRLAFVENFSWQGRTRPPETGILTLQKQGRMRWDYTQPKGKLFISDGQQVYLYTAENNRVEKIAMKDTEDMRAPLAFLLGHLDLKKEFRDFQTKPAKDATWLLAEAKSDRVPYGEIAMLIGDDGPVRELKVAGRDGSSMVFTFANEVLNPPVDEKIFRFVPPAGTEVVDAVAFRAEGK